MLSEHQRLNLALLDGGCIEVEVNFDKHDETSKVLRFFVAGKQYDIKTKDLRDLLLIAGDISIKKDLLPTKLTRVRKLERLLQYEFKASKDYKKDEMITVIAPFIDTRTDIEEVLSGAVEKKLKDRKLIN